MSILIKGMSMPQNGLYQIVNGKICEYDTRGNQTECYELTEVPELHGRLIDADKLIEWAEEEERNGLSLCIDKAEDLEITLNDICPTVIERGEQWEYI